MPRDPTLASMTADKLKSVHLYLVASVLVEYNKEDGHDDHSG